MPKTDETEAPAKTRSVGTITYNDGRVEEHETATPRLLYDANRLGVMNDPIEAGFFTLWLASGKPGVNGGPLSIDTARPAMEAWLDTVKAVEYSELPDGPPTKPRARSRGSAG